jgi:large subunit ribosomal protein L32e
MNDTLLKIRKSMKVKKPTFNKQSSHKKTRLKKKWRKPRGSDSKIRVNKKGYQRKIKIGYKGPSQVRGLTRTGLKIVLVKNMNCLNNINKETDIVCISKLGTRKKLAIINECVNKNLQIYNIKDAKKYVEDIKQEQQKQKEDKKKKQEEKKKKTDKKKKDKKKTGIEAKVDSTDSDSKDTKKVQDEPTKDPEKVEKKEKDKLLTKREL